MVDETSRAIFLHPRPPMGPHVYTSCRTPLRNPGPVQVSDKAVKEVPEVVRELFDWRDRDLLPINPGGGEVLDALKQVSEQGGRGHCQKGSLLVEALRCLNRDEPDDVNDCWYP